MSFVSLGIAGLSNAVDEVYADQPLLRREFDFSCKFVDVLDKGGQNDSLTVWTRGANVFDDLLGESWIEFGLGRHCDVCFVVFGNDGIVRVRGSGEFAAAWNWEVV